MSPEVFNLQGKGQNILYSKYLFSTSNVQCEAKQEKGL